MKLVGGHRPAHHAPAEDVEHDRQIEHSFPRRHVCEVSGPEIVRCRGHELTPDQIRDGMCAGSTPPGHKGVPAMTATQVGVAHQPRDTLTATGCASCSQLRVDARRAIDASTGTINQRYLRPMSASAHALRKGSRDVQA